MGKGVTQTLLLVSATALLLLLAGCSDEMPTGFSPFKAAKGEMTGATIVFDGLVNPSITGAHYEAWAITEAKWVSLGKFLLDVDGSVVDFDGNAIERFDGGENIANADTLAITQEPPNDRDSIPSATVIMSGVIKADMAALSAPLPQNFRQQMRGKFIIGAPTGGPNNTAMPYGVWFVDPAIGPGLVLPFLPNGWKYEGWVNKEDEYVSTGKFTITVGRDESDIHSGPYPAPPYPGEDFFNRPPLYVTFPYDVRGARVFVTIEPDPDDHENLPFQFELLSATVPADGTANTVYTMTNLYQGFPTGQAILY
ncbi:anti-sigma factor [Acidobacteriota bacterium]